MKDRLAPPSESEIALRDMEREIWLAERQRADEENRLAYERERAAKEEAAQREAAIAPEHERTRARLERQERISRDVQERELRDLRFKVTQQEWWQQAVDRASRNAVVQQHRQALLGELDAMINPPPPPEPEPEPQIVYVESDEPETFCGATIPRWRK